MIQLDKFLLSIKKRFLVPAIVLSGIGVWLSICHVHYQSYWLGTIYRVQTADFNMLHHTMPAVLSDMILADRDDLVQRTLDSTYGLFGLMNAWVLRGYKETPQEMAQIVCDWEASSEEK